jgi:hypothetical protein
MIFDMFSFALVMMISSKFIHMYKLVIIFIKVNRN